MEMSAIAHSTAAHTRRSWETQANSNNTRWPAPAKLLKITDSRVNVTVQYPVPPPLRVRPDPRPHRSRAGRADAQRGTGEGAVRLAPGHTPRQSTKT
ncbi:hypothetical protein JCM17961_22430 [Endothiovibrio diazotrophicus]